MTQNVDRRLRGTQPGDLERITGVTAIGQARRADLLGIHWPENPHETPAERARRIEAFTPWAARGFVCCAC